MWFGWIGSLRLGAGRAAPGRAATLPLPKKRPGFVNSKMPPVDIDDSTVVLPDGMGEEDDTVVLVQ
jgi:hypothetical protein